MIHVQIDVLLAPTDDDTTAIWAGHWEARPIAGDLFHIRGGEHDGEYRVISVRWTLFSDPAGGAVHGALVVAEPAELDPVMVLGRFEGHPGHVVPPVAQWPAGGIPPDAESIEQVDPDGVSRRHYWRNLRPGRRFLYAGATDQT